LGLTFDEYQNRTSDTAVYPDNRAIEYTSFGLAGEAGEVANKVKKIIRGDYNDDPVSVLVELADELGDVLWYVSELATTLGINLEDVARKNLAKLQARKEAGTLANTKGRS